MILQFSVESRTTRCFLRIFGDFIFCFDGRSKEDSCKLFLHRSPKVLQEQQLHPEGFLKTRCALEEEDFVNSKRVISGLLFKVKQVLSNLLSSLLVWVVELIVIRTFEVFDFVIHDHFDCDVTHAVTHLVCEELLVCDEEITSVFSELNFYHHFVYFRQFSNVKVVQ
jgi:hypothetical protein